MLSRRIIIYGILFATVTLSVPALFLWARTMIYWWLSPDDSSTAQYTVVSQLIDSANNSEARGQYYPRMHTMIITPHCDEIEVQAPKRWSAFNRRLMDGVGMERQSLVSEFYYEAAEGHNLRKSYSINQMALLVACMEATPFGKMCRATVNEIRWDHEKAEKHLIKSGFLSKVNDKICVTYPQIEFKSQDQK